MIKKKKLCSYMDDNNRREMCMRIIASKLGVPQTERQASRTVLSSSSGNAKDPLSLSHTLPNNMQHAMFGPTCNYALIISFDLLP